jgi:hypothetical protein
MGSGHALPLLAGGSMFCSWTGRHCIGADRAGRKEGRRPDGPGVRHRRHVAGRADQGRPKAVGQLTAVGLGGQAGDDRLV